MKVVFCTPTHTGPHPAYVTAMRDCLPALEALGIEHALLWELGSTYISWARANLARRVIHESDADAIIYLDHDMSWTPAAIVRLATHPEEVVGGTYRFKKEPEEYMGALYHDNGKITSRDDGCVEAAYMPAGFMKVSRGAWHRIAEAYPALKYGDGGLDLFNHGVIDGAWHGEDYAFCYRWREKLGKVWIIPDLDLTHHDRDKAYPGNFHRFLLRGEHGDH